MFDCELDFWIGSFYCSYPSIYAFMACVPTWVITVVARSWNHFVPGLSRATFCLAIIEWFDCYCSTSYNSKSFLLSPEFLFSLDVIYWLLWNSFTLLCLNLVRRRLHCITWWKPTAMSLKLHLILFISKTYFMGLKPH